MPAILNTFTAVTQDTFTISVTIKEMRDVIKNLNPKKTPGYNLITNQIL